MRGGDRQGGTAQGIFRQGTHQGRHGHGTCVTEIRVCVGGIRAIRRRKCFCKKSGSTSKGVEAARGPQRSEGGVCTAGVSLGNGLSQGPGCSLPVWPLKPRQESPHCKRTKARTEDCLRSKREAAAGCQWKKNHHREGRRAEWYQEERFPEGKGFLREAMVQEV